MKIEKISGCIWKKHGSYGRILQDEFGIAMTKKLEGDVMRMCNLSKGVYERAVDKALVDTIKNLLDSTDWDIEKCMDNMKIPDEKRAAYRTAILENPLPV